MSATTAWPVPDRAERRRLAADRQRALTGQFRTRPEPGLTLAESREAA
jgi:hypothetical protein